MRKSSGSALSFSKPNVLTNPQRRHITSTRASGPLSQPCRIRRAIHSSIVALKPKQKAFLAAFAELGSVAEAALVAQVSRESHYDWKKRHEYAEAFAVAQERAGDALEDEARKRARGYSMELVDGEIKKVVHHHSSDRVLLRLLEAAKPEKYSRKTKSEISGPHGGPLKIERIERVIVDPQTTDSAGLPPASPAEPL